MSRGFAIVLMLATCLACGAGSRPADDRRVPILGSELHRVASRAVGDTFQVSVVLPRSYHTDTTRRFPVVYVLDGNELIGVAASVAWAGWITGMPEVILVGVDYPVADLDGSQGIRFRDLTPSADSAAIASMGPEYTKLGLPPPTASGGGSRFIAFLTDELGPRIDSLYRTESSNRTLLGLSLGGLLTLHAFLARQDFYQNYVALSPSLWWNKGETLARFESLDADKHSAARLFVSIGLLEEDPTYRMVSNVRSLEKILGGRKLFVESHFQYFPDENHNSG